MDSWLERCTQLISLAVWGSLSCNVIIIHVKKFFLMWLLPLVSSDSIKGLVDCYSEKLICMGLLLSYQDLVIIIWFIKCNHRPRKVVAAHYIDPLTFSFVDFMTLACSVKWEAKLGLLTSKHFSVCWVFPTFSSPDGSIKFNVFIHSN